MFVGSSVLERPDTRRDLVVEGLPTIFPNIEGVHNDNERFGALHDAEVHRDPTRTQQGVFYDAESGGCNARIWAPNALLIDLCVFKPDDSNAPLKRYRLRPDATMPDGMFSGFLPDLEPGARYGYRLVPKPNAPGHYSTFLLDPFAREIVGDARFCLPDGSPDPAAYPYQIYKDGSHNRFVRSELDSAPCMPRCVVVDTPHYDWENVPRPKQNGGEVIYELNVGGFTASNPNLPEAIRGKFAGIAHPTTIQYLTDHGITAVELMPVQAYVSEPHLQRNEMVNAWGYNTIGFFAPHPAYASSQEAGAPTREFRDMVQALHRAGIKVILDVVYNHTPEQGWDGPILSFRGLDRSYYTYTPDGECHDTTGCGNCLRIDEHSQDPVDNVSRIPRAEDNGALRAPGFALVEESLRYWANDMGVDGFRFDLASPSATQGTGDIQNSRFMELVRDLRASDLLVYVEPWGAHEYNLGAFNPAQEWNDRTWQFLRQFFRGTDIPNSVRSMTAVLGGYIDTANPGSHILDWSTAAREQHRGVAFPTAHDGFTLYDAVAYNTKHNEANGEDNRDGSNAPEQAQRIGGDFGGVSGDPAIEAKRFAIMRSMMTALALVRGPILFVYGTENGRSQQGNNNAYCQPELIQMPWALREDQVALSAYVRRVLQFRHDHPVLTRPYMFNGQERTLVAGTNGELDYEVFSATGQRFRDNPSDARWQRVMQIFISGVSPTPNNPATPDDYDMCIICNGTNETQPVTLPQEWPYAGTWELAVDSSAEATYSDEGPIIPDDGRFVIKGLSVQVLVRCAQRLPHLYGTSPAHAQPSSGQRNDQAALALAA